MTVPSHTQNIQSVPLAQIRVLNPRTRNKRQHREIIDNIDAIGLKRPITVSRRISEDEIHTILFAVRVGSKPFVCSERPKSLPLLLMPQKTTV